MMIVYVLAAIILKANPACSDLVESTQQSIDKQQSKKQIDHAHLMINDISSLHLSDRFSDIVLVVDGERLPAHRVVLASRSKQFNDLLYNGLKESYQMEVLIKKTSITSFKILLRYIYFGRMDLSILEDKVILDLFRISNLFGLTNLELSLSEYLRSNINLDIVCSAYAVARLLQCKDLQDGLLEFIDDHALDVLRSKDFLSLSPEALQDVLMSRDSFVAEELDILLAVCRWIEEHQNHLDPDTKTKVLSVVRYPLISDEQLSEVRESQSVSSDFISDAVKLINTLPPHKLKLREKGKKNINFADPSQGSPVIVENGNAITLKLSHPSFVNYIEINLLHRSFRSYIYYVEVSTDQHDWVRVVDYLNYNCRLIQRLWFRPQVVRYIRVVSNMPPNLKFLKVMYNTHKVKVKNGLVVPKSNVVSISMNASIIEGKIYTNYRMPLDGSYTDWIRLWDGDGQYYKYIVESSVNYWKWEPIVNKSEELARSWQVFQFEPRPIVYIRITGNYSSTDNLFRIILLEAPAQKASGSKIIEVEPAVENNGTKDETDMIKPSAAEDSAI
ncbi:BTB/POZ domain-containing protein 9-like [Adelges cooleyi]|uniref:BTB/POZ domain-containing protein 9-like n=1 Tax=Adelges cooleyi TaxID=133065 RepID=UPI00217FF28C|nr:BTB/POZ domain-containing protein 9-like [Adelges cooleyi]